MNAENPVTKEDWFDRLSLNKANYEGEQIERFMRPSRSDDVVFITEKGDDWFEVTPVELPEGMRIDHFSELLEASLKSAYNRQLERVFKDAMHKRGSREDLEDAIRKAQQYKD